MFKHGQKMFAFLISTVVIIIDLLPFILAIVPATTSEVPQPSEVPDPPRDYTKDVGEAVVHVDEDFDAVTGGNPVQYCASIENEIARAAGVTKDRVDANCT